MGIKDESIEDSLIMSADTAVERGLMCEKPQIIDYVYIKKVMKVF